MHVSVGITTFCHHLESIHAAQRIPRINPAHHFVRKCKIFNFSRVSWSLRRWSWAWAAPESEARMSPMMCRYADYLLEGGARMSSLTSEFKAEHQYHSPNLVMGLCFVHLFWSTVMGSQHIYWMRFKLSWQVFTSFSCTAREWKVFCLAFVSRVSFYRWVRLSLIAKHLIVAQVITSLAAQVKQCSGLAATALLAIMSLNCRLVTSDIPKCSTQTVMADQFRASTNCTA